MVLCIASSLFLIASSVSTDLHKELTGMNTYCIPYATAIHVQFMFPKIATAVLCTDMNTLKKWIS